MAVKSTKTKVTITIISVSKKLSAITSIANTTAISKKITSITKTRDTQSAEMAVAATRISLTSITLVSKSTSTLMMAAKASATITSPLITKETALIVNSNTTNSENKMCQTKNLLSLLGIACSKRLMFICLQVPSVTDILSK